MSEQEAVFFNFDDADASAKTDTRNFAHIPVIRTFESLLTDEDFQSAGLKVAAHPAKNTFYIYPASEVLDADDDSRVRYNRITPASYVFHHIDLWVDPSAGNERTQIDLAPIAQRIEELRESAAADDLPFREKSAREAVEWLRLVSPPNLPNMFLVNNGNIRAFWRNGEEQLGVQFLGDGAAQFVFLGEDDQTERIFGSVKVTELVKRLNGLDLTALLGFHHAEWKSRTAKTSFDTWADHTSTVM